MIGGTLGLFTGMSILSMVEIAFWLMKIPSAFYNAMIKKDKRQSKRSTKRSKSIS